MTSIWAFLLHKMPNYLHINTTFMYRCTLHVVMPFCVIEKAHGIYICSHRYIDRSYIEI